MKRFIKISFLFFGLMLYGWNPMQAQTSEYLTFFDGESIHLRWQGKHSLNLDGYTVYRQVRDKDTWEQLNSAPLNLVTDRDSMNTLVGFKASLFMQLFGISDPAENITRTDYQNLIADPQSVSFMEVMSLVNPELGKLLGQVYSDRQIESGTEYRYRVEISENSRSRDLIQTNFIQTNDPEVVPSVTELAGSGLDQKIVLNWPRNQKLMSSGEIVSYKVYRSEQLFGPYEAVNMYGILTATVGSGDNTSDPTKVEYVDNYLVNGATYFYQVRAVNAFGFESGESISLEVTVGADLLPIPPRNLRAELMGTKLKLEWDLPPGNIQGFNIYRTNPKDSTFSKVFPPTDAALNKTVFWLDMKVEEGYNYFYYIETANESMVSEPSDTIQFFYPDLSPPSPPQDVKAIGGEGGIRISWSANSEPDVAGYEIERASDAEFKTRFLLSSKTITETSFLDSIHDKSQTSYGYVVYAVDNSYNRSEASEMVKARMPDIVAPQKPILTGLELNGSEITLRWTSGIDQDFDKYLIYQSRDSTQFEQINETSESEILITLQQSGFFQFAISGIDQSGNESELSSPLPLIYDTDEFPQAPSKIKAKNSQEGHIIISWDRSLTSNVTGYLISRYTGDSSLLFDLAELPADQSEYIDKNVTKGLTYKYEIRAFNASWKMSEAATTELRLR